MVKTINIVLLISFILVSSSLIKAQNVDIQNFERYKNYGFFITPIVFKKAALQKSYGSNELTPLSYNTIALEFGFKKHFFKEKTWSFITGITLKPIPFFNLLISLKKEDIIFDTSFDEKLNDTFGHFYPSIPLLIEHKMQIAKNTYFNFETGFSIFYIDNGNIYTSFEFANDEQIREVFGVYAVTQENTIQASFIISPGFYFTKKNYLFQINLKYNKNFQNVLEGEYLFDNLLVSPRTRGSYKISGDYIGLSTTVYFKKKKYKKHKKKNEIIY